jgi:hypothetical protein
MSVHVGLGPFREFRYFDLHRDRQNNFHIIKATTAKEERLAEALLRRMNEEDKVYLQDLVGYLTNQNTYF